VEGTLLFITANKPEVLDYALLRSCRVDHRFELGYADKYQTQSIFEMVLPEQKDQFDKFYGKIQSKEFTTAMLQEFLFFNRNENNILEKIEMFFDIIEKNKPESFQTKEKSGNIYM
jgi:ATPases of the AAA+ class